MFDSMAVSHHNDGARSVLDTLPERLTTRSGKGSDMAHHTVSEKLYDFYGPRYRCAYCGDPCDTVDHTVPRWFVSGNDRLMARYRFVKVAACLECNCCLGDKVDVTFRERKLRLAKRVVQRGFRLLETASWDDEELAELGRGLRGHITAAVMDGEHLLRRVNYLRDPSWPHMVPNDIWIALPVSSYETEDGPLSRVQKLQMAKQALAQRRNWSMPHEGYLMIQAQRGES